MMRSKLILTGLILILLTITLNGLGVHADDAADLRQQIEERNKNIANLQLEIQKYKLEADKTSAKAKTLQNSIKELELTGKKIETDIKLTQNKIAAADLSIQKLSGDISTKENSIEALKRATALNLKLMHQEDSHTFLETFLSSKSLAESFDHMTRLLELSSAIKDRSNELRGLKVGLEIDKETTEAKKTEFMELNDELSDKNKVIVANKGEQNKLFTATKNSEAAYQTLIKTTEAKKAALEKEVFDYESKLKYTLNPSSLPQSGSAPFSWPTDEVYITQLFGVTSASGRLYASGSHNGVDFKALLGTPVKALANGTVVGTGNTDLSCPRASYGSWVLIKYDNALSAIFGHLSVIKVSEGQQVTRGQVVAFSGNTGYSTGPHLHVGVYPSNAVSVQDRASLSCAGKILHMPIAPVNAYLDPMLYFPKL